MPAVASITGLDELSRLTLGDSRVTVAIIDGPVDLTHPCFRGARIVRARQSGRGGAPGTLTHATEHATFVASVVFGQPGSAVRGIAPRCRGINVPFVVDDAETSEIDLARAIEEAALLGADIIHVASCRRVDSPRADALLHRTIRQLAAQNRLIVAPTGNEGGAGWCVPAILPEVLAVGALNASGVPFRFSNFGAPYERHGIVAPGDLTAAVPGGGVESRRGTSCAAPVVTGVAALLMSLQLQCGRERDATAVRRAMLDGADRCDTVDRTECARWISGALNITRSVRIVLGGAAARAARGGGSVATSEGPATAAVDARADDSRGVTTAARARHPQRVFALGMLGYDFGSDLRRHAFAKRMQHAAADPDVTAMDPHEPRHVAAHLDRQPHDARFLVWTLSIDGTPVYALEPRRAFAGAVYGLLQRLLAAHHADATGRIERTSVAAALTDRQLTLLSNQSVPVLELDTLRGVYGWSSEAMIGAALDAVSAGTTPADEPRVRRALRGFLEQIYTDPQNRGLKPRHRALNFAATNAYQAASVIAETVPLGLELDTIYVERSGFCRPESDCWDVVLTFDAPEDPRRAGRVYRFTVDVVDVIPVTIGDVRSWPIRPAHPRRAR